MTIKNFIRGMSTATSVFSRYLYMRNSSDIDKVRRMRNYYLAGNKPDTELTSPDKGLFSSKDLGRLIQQIEQKNHRFPIFNLMPRKRVSEAIYFRDNSMFINLPFGKRVSTWPDRAALDKLISTVFLKLFKKGDLVVVPGCAEGQIPITLYANSERHGYNLKIVAADYNAVAMKLGCATMESHGLWPGGINWVQGNATNQNFFDWLKSEFRFNRHQIITLLQPCLLETSLLDLLKNNARFAKTNKLFSRVVMPVLLEDAKSDYYQKCDHFIQTAMKVAEVRKNAPTAIWNECKFGREMLTLSKETNSYEAKQYFMYPGMIEELRSECEYSDAFDKVIDEGQSPMIKSSASTRMLCVWDVDN